MEIERKFLVNYLPFDLGEFEVIHITQGYISIDPVIRIRSEVMKIPREDTGVKELTSIFSSPISSTPMKMRYTLTCKGKGLMAREELNLLISGDAYRHLLSKVEGRLIKKDRYIIPMDDDPDGLVCELDVFKEDLEPLVMAEIEFVSEEEARAFDPPYWFGEEVTDQPAYQNANMSLRKSDL